MRHKSHFRVVDGKIEHFDERPALSPDHWHAAFNPYLIALGPNSGDVDCPKSFFRKKGDALRFTDDFPFLHHDFAAEKYVEFAEDLQAGLLERGREDEDRRRIVAA